MRGRSLRHAALAGVAFVPSDRKRYGLMLERTVWENTAAVSWLGLAFGSPWLNRGRQHDRAQEHAGRLRLRGGIHAQAGHLSGGNQQKVVFAKWLDADPQVVVLDDPTRGVDVGARAEMHAIIRKLAGEGRAVLIASTDLAELVDCCDRVLVFQRGRIVDELRLHIVPLTLGGGERVFDRVPPLDLELIRERVTPEVAHLSYRVRR